MKNNRVTQLVIVVTRYLFGVLARATSARNVRARYRKSGACHTRDRTLLMRTCQSALFLTKEACSEKARSFKHSVTHLKWFILTCQIKNRNLLWKHSCLWKDFAETLNCLSLF